MIERLNWKQFHKKRALYILMFMLFPIPIYVVHTVFQSVALDIATLLVYKVVIYIFTLRPLFKLKCPQCGQRFFPGPGGIIFFPRCDSCGIRLGQAKRHP